jgi:hypothetical protein
MSQKINGTEHANFAIRQNVGVPLPARFCLCGAKSDVTFNIVLFFFHLVYFAKVWRLGNRAQPVGRFRRQQT